MVRKVDFMSKISLIKHNTIPLLLGVIFTFIPVMILTLFSLINSSLNSDFSKVDYESISINGTKTTGVINEVQFKKNITLNGNHPAIIGYNYKANDSLKTSRVLGFKPAMIDTLDVGDKINVKHLNGQSIIMGLEPYKLGEFVFVIAPLILLIGLAFFSFIFILNSRTINLYKNGQIKNGEVISIIEKRSYVKTRSITGAPAPTKYLIHYKYLDDNNNSFFGKSVTSNFALINEMKIGDSIKILIGSNDQSKSCIYPILIASKNHWTT